MNRGREAYNAKARHSVAGSRKKGKPKKHRVSESVEIQQPDSNASILVSISKEEKEQQRKEKLLVELAAQSDAKWTSKKKKRLEKYIDKKLKKEERVLIFEKLAQTQASMDSAVLQSSSTLGTGKLLTHQQLQEQLEDKELRRAMKGISGKRKRHADSFAVTMHGDATDDEDDGNISTSHSTTRIHDHSDEKLPVVIVDSSDPPTAATTVPVVGSALQRNADGTVKPPRIRSYIFGKKKGWGQERQSHVKEESESSFDSSDSEYDSTEDEQEESEMHPDEDESSSANPATENKEEMETPVEYENSPVKKKTLGFKDWALKQLNAAKGYSTSPAKDLTEDSSLSSSPTKPPPPKKRKLDIQSASQEMRGPLGEDLKLPATVFADRLLSAKRDQSTSSFEKAKAIEVTRPFEVEEARLHLPIVSEEQPIMETILLNPVVIICGETGSGKTTQVPQFLYEAGFGFAGSNNPGMIGITQPRRVAAMSMANRVAHELSLSSSKVSYQIRYDATVSTATSIKFMTDGVLLRELATDFLLTKYSVIIIDEAHERSMNTDILVGVLSRVVRLREEMWIARKDNVKPLRLIIMSATLRVSDFAENRVLFPSPPPVINVAARQHPVTIHFSRRTSADYVTESVKKATKIHTRLPPGGILIFLTGQNEITGVCRKLEARFSKKALNDRKQQRGGLQERMTKLHEKEFQEGKRNTSSAQADVEAEDFELGEQSNDIEAFDVDEGMDTGDPEALDSDSELLEELGIDSDETDVPMHIVPLYSLLPSEKQMRVFMPPPEGSRLVVVSTNVAETSLTIPGIRYVVDCGRAKERRYDIANGIQAFQVSWISKASASQRAGRAGRTGPGHCYRLYSSALFEHHFSQFSQPEILRMPIDGVVLQMKNMHIDAVTNFPFPTPPDRFSLQKAEKVLTYLGALSPSGENNSPSLAGAHITELGRVMALFPLSPRFSRMLVGGQQHGCLPYIIAIVSAMSVGDPFIHEEVLQETNDEDINSDADDLTNEKVKNKETLRVRRKAFFLTQHVHSSLGGFTSDMFKYLSVIGAYEYAGGGLDFCKEHFVRPKAMEEIHKLRSQISNIVQINFAGSDAGFVPKIDPPNNLQLKVIRQLLTAAFIDQVAVRKDRADRDQATGLQYATAKGVPYRAIGVTEDVFIHPSSLLANTSPPDYVIFQEIIKTSNIYIKGLTAINPAWLSSLGKGSLCSFSKPVKNKSGDLMVIPRFGPEGWELPAVNAET